MEKEHVQMIIRVSPSLHKRVKAEARKHNLQMSVYLRFVLEHALRNYVPTMMTRKAG